MKKEEKNKIKEELTIWDAVKKRRGKRRMMIEERIDNNGNNFGGNKEL